MNLWLPKATDPFTLKEMECPCGCGRSEMKAQFMYHYIALRFRCGFPFPVTSGFRCPNHNDAVRTGFTRGDHTRGEAGDTKLSNAYHRAIFLKEALSDDYFKEILIDKSFIHLGAAKVLTEVRIGVY